MGAAGVRRAGHGGWAAGPALGLISSVESRWNHRIDADSTVIQRTFSWFFVASAPPLKLFLEAARHTIRMQVDIGQGDFLC